MRLADTQGWVSKESAVLYSRAIQVNDPGSLAEIGQYSIQFAPAYQKVLLHRLAVVRDGKTFDHTKTADMRQLDRENYLESGVYGGETTLQFLLKDVRVGDTLWVTYTIIGENPVFGGRWTKFMGWDSQYPTETRRITVTHPLDRKLVWKQLGDYRTDKLAPKVERIDQLERMSFEDRSIEALEGEPSVPSDYVPGRGLMFTEYDSWESVNSWALGLFPRRSPSADLVEVARKFQALGTPEEKSAAALHWVQDEIRYFSVSIGENSHRPQNPSVVLRNRYGDCKDKTYLLVSLLELLGIEARPVLVSASAPRFPGKLAPTPLAFDHAIVRLTVGGKALFVDPTLTGQKEELAALPTAVPRAFALVVEPGTTALTELPAGDYDSPEVDVSERVVLPSFDGPATLHTTRTYRRYSAAAIRKQFASMSEQISRKFMLGRYEKKYPGIVLETSPRLYEHGDHVVVEANFSVPAPLEKQGTRYGFSFDPKIIEGTLAIPDQVSRNFPLEIASGPYRARYRLDVKWPDRVRMNNEMGARRVHNRFLDVDSEFLFRGNEVNFRMDYHIKQTRIEPSELPALLKEVREFERTQYASFWANPEHQVSEKATAFPMRDLDLLSIAAAIGAKAGKTKTPGADTPMTDLCEIAIGAVLVKEIMPPELRDQLGQMASVFREHGERPGAKKCLAQISYLQGRFADSLAYFNQSGTKVEEFPQLPWVRWHAGDRSTAVADMERSYSSVQTNNVTWADDIRLATMLVRSGKALPEEMRERAREWKSGLWPSPVLALYAGLATPAEVLQAAEQQGAAARELALGEAWFHIGQHWLAQGKTAEARKAFMWLAPNGIRSSEEYLLARAEVSALEVGDVDVQAGLSALEKDDKKAAFAAFSRSAARGHIEGQYRAAMSYYNGTGTAKDFQAAIRLFRAAADAGHAGAQNMVGFMYEKGLGIGASLSDAVKWYERSADGMDPVGLYNIGMCYFDANGVERDYKKAADYLRMSAQLGDQDSYTPLAQLYSQNKDYAQAVYWLRLGADAGVAAAEMELAEHLRLGLGVDKDLKRALALHISAASKGNVRSMYVLGVMHERGQGVDRNYEKAAAFYSEAAEQQAPAAWESLGYLYDKGLGLTKNPEKARALMKKAADVGRPYAQYYLGRMYRFGVGGPADLAAAITYFRKSADQGDPDSLTELAIMAANGQGMDKDLAYARNLYEKAIDLGSTLAMNNLGDMYEIANGVEQDLPRAIELYRRGAAQGSKSCMYSLASVFERGVGVRQDFVLAYTYLELAALNGHTEASSKRSEAASKLTEVERKSALEASGQWKEGMALPGFNEPSAYPAAPE